MTPKFPLGKVTVKEEAAYALALAGQNAGFILEKHACGDWGEETETLNEQGLQQSQMLVSRYNTLRGHEIYVMTFPNRQETCVCCPPNSVINYVPLPDFEMWRQKE